MAAKSSSNSSSAWLNWRGAFVSTISVLAHPQRDRELRDEAAGPDPVLVDLERILEEAGGVTSGLVLDHPPHQSVAQRELGARRGWKVAATLRRRQAEAAHRLVDDPEAGQVAADQLHGRPLVWVEELSTYAFIWGTFLGAAAGLKQGRHIKIQSFVGALPAVLRDTIRVVLDLLIGVFCLLLVVNGVKAMLIFEWSQRTIALPFELPRYLFYSTPLILGSASMTLTALYDLLLILAGRHRAVQAEEVLPV